MENLDFYKSIASTIKYPSQAYINGKYQDAISGNVFENINPATAEVLGTVSHCDHLDVDIAVKAARKSFDNGEWSRCAPEKRKEVLMKLADLIRQNADELAVIESLDSGKTITDCLDEIGGEVPDFFQWYGELIDKTFGKVVPTGEDAAAFIVKEPVGVVGLVVPWNFPLLMAAWKMAPALAAGCSVIVKPAEQTPLTAIRLAQLAEDAGVPPGVINILPGFGETAGEALGRHSDVDVMSFTGSTEVGGYFLKYSSESNLKTVGLEMGGKSPFIILDDAEITDDLIENAVSSAFWNGGQNCSANMRQIVDKRLKDDYLHRIIKLTESYKVGEPLDPNTDLGSMITQEHQQRVLSYIAKGCDEGANLIAGKNGAMDREGYFIQPTIFDNVDPQSTIAKEEIFGPVLGVVTVDGMDEALRIARDTEYGLHATVFTKDIGRAFHMARHLPVGTVGINGFTEGDIKTPFGGFKKSGSLARDNGTEAMDQYLQTKTIWFNL
ncbi:aldehyde dehydrogenase [Candidatus Thioglobus sp. NP1]|jgi:aldehyde dehydrogenase (NAD+)/gamma-glutamyl-gamma-aminobutyraldehyde dehydrogenase|uniref:aldehyde dehydrogenase n=1 Tax=Candidatus Thioglobus sp. NP1 TaxID=2508687 RepID=UPI000DEDBD1D|nr:aldehyde dehydrogenase [Candidatus Thioglobus sp. NP1]AXE61244.1 aldehyde dehydrogenase [Candidatus Thioglobus sp. NP1]